LAKLFTHVTSTSKNHRIHSVQPEQHTCTVVPCFDTLTLQLVTKTVLAIAHAHE